MNTKVDTKGASNNTSKETIVAAKPAEAPTVFVTHVAGSKAELAQKIFNEDGRNKPRKEVIGRMIKETGLSVAGAGTYYQNMKKAAGMVNKRVLVTTEVVQGGTTPTAAQAEANAETKTTA